MLGLVELHADVSALAMIGGLLAPLIVAFGAKEMANRALKSVIMAGLSGLAGMIALWIKADGNIDLYASIESIGTALIAAVATYYGFWKPTGVAPAIASVTSGFGVGSNNPNSAFGDSTLVEPTSTAGTAGVAGTQNAASLTDDGPKEQPSYQGQILEDDAEAHRRGDGTPI